MTQTAQHGSTDLRQKRRHLTEAEKTNIWVAVCKKMNSSDRDPNEVIIDSYNGNIEAWCWDMIRWHNLWYLLSRSN